MGSVTEPSDAINVGMAKQTEGQRTAFSRKSPPKVNCLVGWFVGLLVNNTPSVLNIREGVVLVWGMTACKLIILYKHTATIRNIRYTFFGKSELIRYNVSQNPKIKPINL